MLELLSLLFGGVLRLAPELLGFFRARDDRAHELRMTQLQLDIDKARAQQQIDLAHAQAAIAADQADMVALVEAVQAQARPSGVPWIDALSSSVRPVLTYWWCVGLYTAYKVIAITLLLQAGTGLAALLPQLVTDFDKSVIGSMFAFWFVDRSLRKGRV